MHRSVFLSACCAAPIIFSLPSLAQTTPSPQGGAAPDIASLTCADIASLSPGHQGALIYYAAGYLDGLSANTSAGGMSSSAPSGSTSSAAAGAGDGAAGNGQVAGLGLQAGDVMRACLAQPTARLMDAIKAAGGSPGLAAPAGSEVSSSSAMGSSDQMSSSSTLSDGTSASSSSYSGSSSGEAGGSSAETATSSSSTSQ